MSSITSSSITASSSHSQIHEAACPSLQPNAISIASLPQPFPPTVSYVQPLDYQSNFELNKAFSTSISIPTQRILIAFINLFFQAGKPALVHPFSY